MARSKQKHDWTLASEVLAGIYNTVRDPKKRRKPFIGNNFNPTIPKKTATQTITVAQWRDMAGAAGGSQRK